jgi:hypothetical protein
MIPEAIELETSAIPIIKKRTRDPIIRDTLSDNFKTLLLAISYARLARIK